jgi:hypothetical protein
VSRELIEFFRVEAGSERAERLASLLTLSYEPMLVWELMDQSNFGTPGLNGSMDMPMTAHIWWLWGQIVISGPQMTLRMVRLGE